MLRINPYQSPVHDSGDDRDTRRHSPASRRRWAVWAVAYFYPLLAAAIFYGSWLVAWACLGRQPRMSLDDPKEIGGLMDLAYLLSALVLVTAPLIIPFCFWASFLCPLRSSPRSSLRWLLACGYVCMTAGVYLTIRLDPGRVMEWWLD